MKVLDNPDLFHNHLCAFCRKHGAAFKVEINPPDDSTLIYKFFCNSSCLANWGTGQKRPA